MSTACEGWPSQEFQTWDDDTKVQFFRCGLKGNDVKKHYTRMVAKKMIECRINQNAGEMRPLEYWAAQGYDRERIKQFTPECDKEYSDQCGQMYRITVNSQIASTTIEREQAEILNKMGSRKAVHKMAKEAKARVRVLGRHPSLSSSSSTPSSVSSSPAKKKNKKPRTKRRRLASARQRMMRRKRPRRNKKKKRSWPRTGHVWPV